jgi:hypothetical protein
VTLRRFPTWDVARPKPDSFRRILFKHRCHCNYFNKLFSKTGRAVAHLVEALRHKPEGRGFDSQWCQWNFSLTKSFRPQYGPGVDSASEIKEYQEYFLGGKGGQCVGLTTLPPSCTDCLEIWEHQLPGNLKACPGLHLFV